MLHLSRRRNGGRHGCTGLQQGALEPRTARGDHRRQPASCRGLLAERRGARLVPSRPALHLCGVRRRGRRSRGGTCRPGSGDRRSGRHLEPEPSRVGRAPVRHCSRRRDPRHDQPGLPHRRAALRRAAVGVQVGRGGARVQGRRLRRHARRDPARRPRPRTGDPVRLTRVASPGHRRDPPWPLGGRRTGGHTASRRSDQHPVHEWHHRIPEGRHALAPQHLEQRVLRGRALWLHRRRPRVHSGALLPLLRHGAGQPGVHHPRRGDGDSRRGVRPGRLPARGGRRALHEPLRGAHDVHRRARGAGTSTSSTCRRFVPGSWRGRRARSR